MAIPERLRAAWPLEAGPRRLLLVGPAPETFGSWSPIVRTAQHEPFQEPDESFDAVLLATRRAFREPFVPLLAEVQRVLRPGGLLLVDPPPTVPRAYVSRFVAQLRHYFDAHETGGVVVARRRSARDPSHFEQIAPEYWAELPPHVTEHYLERKVAVIKAALPADPEGLLGLDLGCGVGKYAQAVAERLRVRLVGIDPASGNVREARAAGVDSSRAGFAAADALHLPFADRTFDFAYTINVLHHLKRGEQERALDEVWRVLKPGAPLVVLEMNTRNPLFRWYLRHVYPKTRRIDRGDEEFIHPDRLPLSRRFLLEDIHYSTFAPDFVPRWSLPAVRALERLLERAFPRHAIHYGALLRRPPTTA